VFSRSSSLSTGDIQAVGRMYPRFVDSWAPQVHSNFGAGITSWAPGRLDVVAVNDAGNLVHQFFNEGWGWSGWVDNWGGILTSSVDVTSWGLERLDVVGRGTDNQVWHFWYDRGNTGWEPMGKTTLFAPTIASQGFGSLDMFCIGTDNQLWSRAYRSATGWGAWTARGGVLTTAADAQASNGRVDLVSRNSWNRLVHMSGNGSSFGGWSDIGGALTSRPTISSWQNGHWDTFGEGGDGNLWKRSYQGSWEINWSLVGGSASETDAFSWGPGRIDMVIRDRSSGNIRHLFVNN
jgi:hypothetical protein